MIPLPEELLVPEHRLEDIFTIPPLGPVLSEMNTVSQLLSSKRITSKDEIISAIGERSHVVVGIQEDHDIVRLTLSKKVVGSLIAKAQWLVRIHTRNTSEIAYSCSSSTLALWAVYRDRQDAIRNVIDRPLPVPPLDRCSDNRCWLEISVRDRLAPDRTQIHRGGGSFSG